MIREIVHVIGKSDLALIDMPHNFIIVLNGPLVVMVHVTA
jgi:hypothetical protein